MTDSALQHKNPIANTKQSLGETERGREKQRGHRKRDRGESQREEQRERHGAHIACFDAGLTMNGASKRLVQKICLNFEV